MKNFEIEPLELDLLEIEIEPLELDLPEFEIQELPTAIMHE